MTDAPTDRAALEALAERLVRRSICAANGLEDDLLEAADTLHALAAEREPPADVAALVEDAEALYHEWRRCTLATWPLSERTPSIDSLISGDRLAIHVRRLAAALTAQAERIAELEAAPFNYAAYAAAVASQRERADRAEAACEPLANELANIEAEFARDGDWPWPDEKPVRVTLTMGQLRAAALALAAKLKGETE